MLVIPQFKCLAFQGETLQIGSRLEPHFCLIDNPLRSDKSGLVSHDLLPCGTDIESDFPFQADSNFEIFLSSLVTKNMMVRKRRNRDNFANCQNVSAAESTVTSHATELKQSTKRRKLRIPRSRLEQLPNELLEEIFLYACNINLATACPAIGARLSSRLTYMRFCKKTFCYLRTNGMKSYGNWRHTGPSFSTVAHTFCVQYSAPPLDCSELIFARNTALQCRWMTYEFWKDMKRHIIESEKKRLMNCFSSTEAYATYCANGFNIALGSHGLVPSKLLTWPISKENRDFIVELCELGAQIDWMHTMDGEKVEFALHRTIRADDFDLIQLLTRHEIGMAVDTGLVREMMEFCSEGTLRSFVLPNIRTRTQSIDWTDEKLWAVAHARQSREGSSWPVQLLESVVDRLIGSPSWEETDMEDFDANES